MNTMAHAIRTVITGTLCLVTSLVATRPAAAQGGGFFVETTGDYSPVEISTTHETWQSARLSGGWFEDGRSGWTLSMERQQRAQQIDWGGWARGFRRSGDWTFSGGLGRGADPTFSYRQSYEGGVGRRVVGNLVAEGAYRYLDFNTASVHLIQPGATLYMPHGDIGAHYFIVHNATRATTTGTLLVQATVNASSRVRLGGGGAYGERIYDIASLQTPNANAWVGYGYAHITASQAWSFDLGLGRSHEEPFFSQTSVTWGVRRTFGGHP